MSKINLFKNGYPFAVTYLQFAEKGYTERNEITCEIKNAGVDFLSNWTNLYSYSKFVVEIEHFLKQHKDFELIYILDSCYWGEPNSGYLYHKKKRLVPYFIIPYKRSYAIVPVCLDECGYYFSLEKESILMTIKDKKNIFNKNMKWVSADGIQFNIFMFINSPLIETSDFIKYRENVFNYLEEIGEG